MEAEPAPSLHPIRLGTVGEAHGFSARLAGWMGRREVPAGSFLCFAGTRALHTCFMRFALDIVFVDERRRVVEVRPGVPPFRFVAGPRAAAAALECRAGDAERLGIRAGRVLAW